MPIDELPLGIVEALTNGIGVIGVVLLIFWMITTGRLVTRREVDRMVAEHARQIALLQNRIADGDHEANEWRTEGRIKDTQIAEKDTQLRHLAEVGKSVESIMHVLQKARSGGSEVAP